MVRSELLRAKSLHAEVAYLRDLKRVGDAKRHEEQQSQALREKERKFWAEAVKGKNPLNTSTAPAGQNPATAMQASAQLERIHRAHSQLKEAHRTHSDAAKTLKDGLATLSSSQKRVEILEKLLAKAQRIRANQVESRLSEEVADLVTTSRTVMNLRNMRSAEAEPRDDVLTSQSWRAESQGLDGDSIAQRVQSNTLASVVPTPAQTSPVAQQLPPATMHSVSNLGSTHSTSAPSQIGISNVTVRSTQSQPSIALTCTLPRSGSFGLQLTKAEGGGIKVLIDPSVGSIASGVLRDKGAIQSRLQAMGIKVTEIDIGVSDEAAGIMKRTKRALASEEEDEGNIP
jgi:hypothetical protein